MDEDLRQQLDRRWLVETCKRVVGDRSIRSVAINELDMTGPGLTQWLSGERATEDIRMKGFRALAKALGMTPVELMKDYEDFLKQGDQAGEEPDKSSLRLLRQTVETLLRQINTIDMTDPTPDARVVRLSSFLKAFFQHHGLDWEKTGDRREFAESTGEIGSPECPWRSEDSLSPDGLLYQAIVGTLDEVTGSVLFGVSTSCSGLANKEMTLSELESICNGGDAADWLSYCNHNNHV